MSAARSTSLYAAFEFDSTLQLAINFRLQVNVEDGFLYLITQDGTSKDDVKVPDSDLGKQIEDDFEAGKDLLVTIVSAMGEEAAISYKEAPKGS